MFPGCGTQCRVEPLSSYRRRGIIALAAFVWGTCLIVAAFGGQYLFGGEHLRTELNSKEAYAFGQSDYFRTVFGNVGYVFAGGSQTSLDSFELQYLPAVADGRPKLCVVVRRFALPDGNTVIQQTGNIYQCR